MKKACRRRENRHGCPERSGGTRTEGKVDLYRTKHSIFRHNQALVTIVVAVVDDVCSTDNYLLLHPSSYSHYVDRNQQHPSKQPISLLPCVPSLCSLEPSVQAHPLVLYNTKLTQIFSNPLKYWVNPTFKMQHKINKAKILKICEFKKKIDRSLGHIGRV